MIDQNQGAGENAQLNQGISQLPQQSLPMNPAGIQNLILPPNIDSYQPDSKGQELYTVMKNVVEHRQGVKYRDVYGRIQDKPIPQAETNLLAPKKEDGRPVITNVQNEFKDLFNKGMLQNNSYRKRILHLLIFVILLSCCFWQGLCMHMNICYGERLVMEEWFSQTICPLLFIMIFCCCILYFTADYLYKPGIQIMNIFIIICTLLFIAFGIYGIIQETTIDPAQDIFLRFNRMSSNSRSFYDNDQNVFFKRYQTNMLITSIFYLIIGVFGIILLVFSYQFYYILTETVFNWRPPLRSRFHDDRAERIIELYAAYNEEFRRLHEAENKKQLDKNRVMPLNENPESGQMIELPGIVKNDKDIKQEEEFNRSQQLPGGLPKGTNAQGKLPTVNDGLISDQPKANLPEQQSNLPQGDNNTFKPIQPLPRANPDVNPNPNANTGVGSGSGGLKRRLPAMKKPTDT